MTSVKRILVPIDFSPGSEHALAWASDLAQRYDAAIEVLHVIVIPSFAAPDPTVPDLGATELELEVEARRVSEAELTEVIARLPAPERVVARHLVTGSPALAILDKAAEGFDLVVMSTHGRTGLEHLLVGSVAEKVVQKSPCPVLTVR